MALFLEKKIGFSQIGELVGSVMDTLKLQEVATLDAVLETDRLARELVYSNIGVRPDKG